MKRDENGVAVPGEDIQLPSFVTHDRIYDSEGTWIAEARTEWLADYFSHAANYHERLAEIVRRLADAPTNMGQTFFAGYTMQLIGEAKSLWDEMQENHADE